MSDILGDRNLQDLSQNRAELRVWLPQEIKTALDEVIEQQNEVAAKFVREFFVIYLFLASHFLGHTLFAEKLKTWSDDQDRFRMEWEEGIRESESVSHDDKAQAVADGNRAVTELR